MVSELVPPEVSLLDIPGDTPPGEVFVKARSKSASDIDGRTDVNECAALGFAENENVNAPGTIWDVGRK